MQPNQVNDLIDLDLVHSIHTSERRSFRTCRRKWDWIYNDGYHPTDPIKPLEFGTAYHAAMERYYEPSTWHFDRDVLAASAIAEFRRHNERQRLLALEASANGNKSGPESDIESDYNERIELGVGMLKHYFYDVAPKLDFFTPVKVEVGFEVPLHRPGSEEFIFCTCARCWAKWSSSVHGQQLTATAMRELGISEEDYRAGGPGRWLGLPVTVGGRLDLLAKDDQDQYWIFDWKTCTQLLSDFDFSLFVDDQISTYLLALKRLGVNVVGFVYHEQVKTYPEAPEPLKRSHQGRLFSTAKNQSTTYELYLSTVEEGDPQGFQQGLYDTYLSYLKEFGPRFFNRRQLYRTDAELLATEEAIFLEFSDMQNGGIYPNPSRFFCNNCPFKEPCLAKNQGADYIYALDTMFAKGRR